MHDALPPSLPPAIIRRFNFLVDARLWHLHRLPRLELSVLLVLLRHTRNDTGNTFVSVQRIAEMLRLRNVYRVSLAARALAAKRYVEVLRKGCGRGNPTVYHVRLLPEEWCDEPERAAAVRAESRIERAVTVKRDHGQKAYHIGAQRPTTRVRLTPRNVRRT